MQIHIENSNLAFDYLDTVIIINQLIVLYSSLVLREIIFRPLVFKNVSSF